MHYQKKLGEYQSKANIKGFRKGHVPLQLVKQFYGSDLKNTVFGQLMDDSVFQVIKDQKIRAVNQPTIEKIDETVNPNFDENLDFKFIASVEIIPEIEPKDYLGVKLKRENVQVTEKDLDNVIDTLRGHYAEIEHAVEGHNVQNGDSVQFIYKGKITQADGKIILPESMQGSRENFMGQNELLPEFESQLIGMKKGNTKHFDIDYPADYPEKEIAGQKVNFEITVNEIKVKNLPKVDDEFAVTAGYENVEQMKKQAKEHLLKTKTDESDRNLKNALIQALIDKNTFEVPPSLVATQTEEVKKEFVTYLKEQGFTDAMMNDAVAGQAKEMGQRAEGQVKAGILLNSIAKKEGLKVEQVQLETEYQRQATQARRSVNEIKEFYTKNQERMDNLLYRLLEDSTLNFLIEKAKLSTS